MPLASLRCRPARFDDERLNQKVKICYLKKLECIENWLYACFRFFRYFFKFIFLPRILKKRSIDFGGMDGRMCGAVLTCSSCTYSNFSIGSSSTSCVLRFVAKTSGISTEEGISKPDCQYTKCVPLPYTLNLN